MHDYDEDRTVYVVLNRKHNLRSTYCSEANDRHEASYSLSATAELLVSYPLHLTPLLRGSPSEYRHPVWYGKTRMMGLPDGEKAVRICVTV